MNSGRHFETPPLRSIELNAAKKQGYISVATSLAEKCWAYHNHHSDAPDSIYSGRLGACAYLRLRLALHFMALAANPLTGAVEKQISTEHSEQLLADGLKETQKVLSKVHRSSGYFRRFTLLEGPLVGALALQTVFLYLVGHGMEADRSANELLSIGKTIRDHLNEDECEVLYGRCGYLHAILFIRKYLSRPDFGRDVAVSIIDQVISNGMRTAAQLSHHWPVAWTWHGKLYLGACHGVSGILFTLLHFLPELEIISQQKGINLLDILKETLEKLNGTQCHGSATSFGSKRHLLRDTLETLSTGNLASSFGSKRDELVQWCHGAPGHVMLLLKAHEVFNDDRYLELAEFISRHTIFSRGLLKKGVGLCHGIAGNAYPFLSIYRCLKKKEGVDAEHGEIDEWLQRACNFADFGIEMLQELEHTPDKPYSLYEGVAGFSCLLIDLQSPEDSNSRFPCYEI